MKVRNIFGTTFRGQIGKKLVASSWKGKEYIRAYTKQRVSKTDEQLEQRALFKEAVQAWQVLTDRQQDFYDSMADGMTGFNLFVSRYIRAVRNEQEPEIPIPMSWTTHDGKPVSYGRLVVLQGGKTVFNDSLKDARGEIALTPSDAPYVFVLRKGSDEDEVLTIRDLLETDVPMTIESERLGIKLVADVPTSPEQTQPAEPVAEAEI